MNRVIKIDVNKIIPNPYQPRKKFNREQMAQLTHSIKFNGLLQPITIRPSRTQEGYFEVITGERRLRATRALGIEQIDSIIINYDDRSTMRATTIENLQRDDLNPIEEALAYKQLKEEFNITQDKISNLVSKSRAKVANTMRLLELPKEVQEMMIEGEISASFGRTLLGLKDEEIITIWAGDEQKRNLTVNQLEKEIKNFLEPKDIVKENSKIKVNNNMWKGSFDDKKKNINFTFKNDKQYKKVLEFIEKLEVK